MGVFDYWRRRSRLSKAKTDAVRPSAADPRRHWAIDHFPCTSTAGEPGFALGPHCSRTRAAHLPNGVVGGGFNPAPFIAFNEEYFEWTDLFEAILSAGERFTFVEIGAGYGRWSSQAAAAARPKGKAIRLALAEAEPQHVLWLHEHMADNDVAPADHHVVEAAIGDQRKRTRLSIGLPASDDGPKEWFGQSISGWHEGDLHTPAGDYYGRPMTECGGFRFIEVDQTLLSDVLEPLDFVDLLDMDIQGGEAAAVGASLEALTAKVRRMHIETHNHEVEVALREQLTGAGWICLRDYECWATHDTPFGSAYFEGGVQTWVNPKLL